MEEDVLALSAPSSDMLDPNTEARDPISCLPTRPSSMKRIQLGAAESAKPIRFVPTVIKELSSSQACTSSSTFPRVFILNDSFYNMMDFKAEHGISPRLLMRWLLSSMRYKSSLSLCNVLF